MSDVDQAKRRHTLKRDWRYSISSMWQRMQGSNHQDQLVEASKILSELKEQISRESKHNFALEKEIRDLDQKIALLVKNRISLEEAEAETGDYESLKRQTKLDDERQRKYYEHLFYLLQAHPYYMARLAHEVQLGEIESLLRTIMFTLYGNQYDAHDEHKLLILFENVLSKVYEEAKEKGSLMRANTAITRMMTTYTRRGPGQDYLKETLTNPISKLCDDEKLNLEVNPLKVYDQLINDYETETGNKSPLPRVVSNEETLANEDVQKIIKARIPDLLTTSNQFLDCIVESAEAVPYGIRWICKQISVLTKNKFPDASKKERGSLIGGFFLLRFVNPCIVTPHSFMLVTKKPSPTSRRNLTFIAKLMQNLSNGIRFGEKEPYMAPFNSFIEDNEERIFNFFEKLCDVDDPKDHFEMDEYLALARTSIPMVEISLNEVYLIHKLINKHLDVICEDDSCIRDIMKDLGPAPEQIPRSLNGTIQLHLVSPFETEAAFTNEKIVASQVYSDTKALLFNLFRALPELSTSEMPLTQSLEKVITKHSDSKASAEPFDQGVVDLVQLVLDNLQILEDAGLITSTDNFERLIREVNLEVENIGAKLITISKQKTELEHVLKNIKEHTSYLLQQHSSFGFYLDNVREKAYKTQKKTKAKKSSKAKTVTISHVDLEKKGIITDSDVPEERRQYVQFSFSSPRPGVFGILVKYKGQGRNKELYDMELFLDDLLEQQHRGEMEYDLEYVTLDVNMLVHLIKKTFMS